MNRVLIRVIGAPLLLAGIALCVYADSSRKTTSAVTVLIACFAVLSFRELCAMGRLRELKPAAILGMAGIIVSFCAVLDLLPEGWRLPEMWMMFTFVLLLKLVFRSDSFRPADAGFTLLAFLYVSFLLYITEARHEGSPSWPYWLLFLVATNKGSDMAAYVVGKAIGRHKLAPTVSPNKTWEGSIAGLLAGTALGYVVLQTWRAEVPGALEMRVEGQAFLLAAAAAVTVAAQLGDLVKSAIKRWAGVKDSGRFLPEFGGALDMVDSFILSAPVASWLVLGRY